MVVLKFPPRVRESHRAFDFFGGSMRADSPTRRQGTALGARETKWQGNEVRKSNFSLERHVQSIGRHGLEFRLNCTILMSSSANLRPFTLLYGKRRTLLEAQPSHLTPKTA